MSDSSNPLPGLEGLAPSVGSASPSPKRRRAPLPRTIREPRACIACQETFSPRNTQQKTCSPHCRKLHLAALNKALGKKRRKGPSTATCRVCGGAFAAISKSHVICSDKCAKENASAKKASRARRSTSPLPSVACKVCKTTFTIKSWRHARQAVCSKVCGANHGAKLRKSLPKDSLNLKSLKKILGRRNLTLADYHRMRDEQEGKCAICGTTDPGLRHSARLLIDHDHQTGKVRGLLCNGCNTGLGAFKDAPEALLRAAAYLIRHMKKADLLDLQGADAVDALEAEILALSWQAVA